MLGGDLSSAVPAAGIAALGVGGCRDAGVGMMMLLNQ